MKSTSLLHPLALVVALLGFVAAGEAGPIMYVQTGIASGTIGGTDFTDALVQVIVNGDTANVVPVFGGTGVANPSTSTTVTIAAIGTAAVTHPTVIYSSLTAISPTHLPGSAVCRHRNAG